MNNPAVVPSQAAVHDWQRLWRWYALLLVVTLAVCAPSFTAMVQTWWQSSTFAHCFAIVPISAWLIWEKREQLTAMRPRPMLWLPLLTTGLLCGLWVFSRLAEVMLFQQSFALALILVIFWMMAGVAIVKVVWFPLLFTWFALPFGEALVPHLQDMTAAISVRFLQWSGIPVLLEGRLIQIPSGDFVVEKACSGIRYLIASVAVGSLFTYLFYRRWWKAVLFLLASAVIPLLANGIRAFMIILLAHWSNMRLATGVDHLIYGWFFFAFIMLLMFWIGFRFRDHGSGAMTVTVGTAQFVKPAGMVKPAGAYVAVLAITAFLYYGWLDAPLPARPFALQMPVLPGWEKHDAPDDLLPVPASVSQMASVLYTRDQQPDYLLVAGYFAASDQAAELINSEHHWFQQPWRWLEDRSITLHLGGRTVAVHGLLVQHLHLDRRRLLVYWYDVGGKVSARGMTVKWWETMAKLRRDGLGSAFWMVGADYDVEPGEVQTGIDTFIQQAYPLLQRRMWGHHE